MCGGGRGVSGEPHPHLGVLVPPRGHFVLPNAPSRVPLIDKSFPPFPVCSSCALATYPRVRSSSHAEPCHPGPQLRTTDVRSYSPRVFAASIASFLSGWRKRYLAKVFSVMPARWHRRSNGMPRDAPSSTRAQSGSAISFGAGPFFLSGLERRIPLTFHPFLFPGSFTTTSLVPPMPSLCLTKYARELPLPFPVVSYCIPSHPGASSPCAPMTGASENLCVPSKT